MDSDPPTAVLAKRSSVAVIVLGGAHELTFSIRRTGIAGNMCG